MTTTYVDSITRIEKAGEIQNPNHPIDPLGIIAPNDDSRSDYEAQENQNINESQKAAIDKGNAIQVSILA